MEDDLNFKAALLSLFNNKNLKKKGFDTIEIDLVLLYRYFIFCIGISQHGTAKYEIN